MSDAPQSASDSSAPPPQQPPKGALGVIFLIVLIDLLGFGIIIPLLPFYVPGFEENAFKENALKVTLLFSIFSIFQFVGAPILGMLSDRFGRRPVLIISQFGSAAGYVLLGVATLWKDSNPGLMLALVYLSRVIDGFTGGNISTAQAYVSDVTTPETRAKGMGVLGAAFGLGFCVGPFLGGTLGHYNVAYPAYAAAALALFAAVLSYFRLKEPPRHRTTEITAWLHPSRFLPILRKPVLLQLLAVSFFVMAAFVMMESTIALYLNHTFGYEERHVGYFFGFLGVIIIIVQGGLIGRLTPRLGEWTLAVAGTLLVALGMAGFIATAWQPALALLLLAGAANAAGRSFQQPTVSSLISKFSDPRDQGVVFGLYHGLGSLARVAGPLLAGVTYPLFEHTGAFLTAGAIAVLMALWTLALRQPAPRPASEAAVAEAAVEVA